MQVCSTFLSVMWLCIIFFIDVVFAWFSCTVKENRLSLSPCYTLRHSDRPYIHTYRQTDVAHYRLNFLPFEQALSSLPWRLFLAFNKHLGSERMQLCSAPWPAVNALVSGSSWVYTLPGYTHPQSFEPPLLHVSACYLNKGIWLKGQDGLVLAFPLKRFWVRSPMSTA